MKQLARVTLTVAGLATILATRGSSNAADLSDRAALPTTAMHVGAIELQSAGVMSFSGDGTLFLADPHTALRRVPERLRHVDGVDDRGARIGEKEGAIAGE
jgi:hypothetical protein